MSADAFPDDPVLACLWRGDAVESQHRGAWVLADADGRVLDGEGGHDARFFVRSAIKCVQALPLLESGAAEGAACDDADVALALASHNGEPLHTTRVAALLARLDLAPDDLRCGVQQPGDGPTREALVRNGEAPSALHNNCSGKHAGFLALARHFGAPAETYLDPQGAVQRAVRAAVLELTDTAPDDLTFATDGCSAPTWRMPLTGLATAFARVATPDGLSAARRAACLRITASAVAHPVLIAGTRGRLCTALLEVGEGRLFPKVGAEGVYAVGIVGAGRALAVKIDDGAGRALNAVVVSLLARLGALSPEQERALRSYAGVRITNWAGLEVGRIEVLARPRRTT
jgi:L-asparaginase II